MTYVAGQVKQGLRQQILPQQPGTPGARRAPERYFVVIAQRHHWMAAAWISDFWPGMQICDWADQHLMLAQTACLDPTSDWRHLLRRELLDKAALAIEQILVVDWEQ